MAQLAPHPKPQFFDGNGDPLAGGKIWTYKTGGSTVLTTYKDAALGATNLNPVILDERGEAAIYITESARFVVMTSADVTLYTVDNVGDFPTTTVTWTTLGASAYVQTLLDDASAAAFMTTLGISAYIQTLLNDANAGTARTTLGVIPLLRSRFRFKDADEIYLGTGAYWHKGGTTDQVCYWSSELTLAMTVAGTTWYYIYLDDSAIVTAGTNLLTATEFTYTTQTPTWSETNRGWYNGTDLCIGAVRVTSGNIIEFWHDGGDLVQFSTQIQSSIWDVDIDDTWVDCDVYGPNFGDGTRVLCNFQSGYTSSGGGYIWYRKNGTSGTGHIVCGGDDSQYDGAQAVVYTDGQYIEVHYQNSTNATLGVALSGWYFPRGM